MPTSGLMGDIVLLAIVLMCTLALWVSYLAVAWIARRANQRDPALDALRTRLASGEIDEAEFQRLQSILQAH